MSYYDEEITIGGPDTKSLSAIKVNRIPNGSATGAASTSRMSLEGLNSAQRISERVSGSSRARQTTISKSNSTDDYGLLSEIIDHDDGDDDDDDDDESPDDDSDKQGPPPPTAASRLLPSKQAAKPSARSSATAQQRPQEARPGSTRIAALLSHDSEHSDECESDDARDLGAPSNMPFMPTLKPRITNEAEPIKPRSSVISTNSSEETQQQMNITPEKWEDLSVHQEIKDLFPYILKYTPQNIETAYHLQPFVPEYLPSVGDVDAFLKVTIPILPEAQRQHEINDHLRKLGLHFLDEPSGEQSQASLLNMKLRSVLTGSGVNPRSASAALIATANTKKDIDQWISEIEKLHMSASIYDTQPRKNIDMLLIDWPRAYADAEQPTQDAYQRCLRQDITLIEYIRKLSEQFGVDEGPLETQADYILCIQTLFAIYLAANQAWE